MDIDDILVRILFIFIAAIICGAITNCQVDKSWRDQIAAHGCAEFYIDGDHVCQWRWLDCKK